MDNVIAVMEANHPHLTTQKSFYVEISRARDRAELVTDDAKALREHLETATGERVSALEGIGIERDKTLEPEGSGEKSRGTGLESPAGEPGMRRESEPGKTPERKSIEHDLGL